LLDLVVAQEARRDAAVAPVVAMLAVAADGLGRRQVGGGLRMGLAGLLDLLGVGLPDIDIGDRRLAGRLTTRLRRAGFGLGRRRRRGRIGYGDRLGLGVLLAIGRDLI